MNAEVNQKPRCLVILAVYTLLAIILTWPLAAQFTSHVPGGNNDLFQNYWNLWLWKTSFFEQGASPYSTDMLFSGTETSLAFHTHSPANTLLTLPFLLLLGEGAALSLATLCGFILAAFGAHAGEAEIRKNLKERIPQFPAIEEITKTPMPGLYEVRVSHNSNIRRANGALPALDDPRHPRAIEPILDLLWSLLRAQLPVCLAQRPDAAAGSARALAHRASKTSA